MGSLSKQKQIITIPPTSLRPISHEPSCFSHELSSMSLFFFSLLLFLSTTQVSTNSLDSTIQYYAFKELSHAKTGVLYRIPLPSNLSGIQASAIRFRSKSFFSKGANTSAFRIPPETVSLPHVQRLVFVYQNLGNRSSSYYRVPAGYSLSSPVVGFLVYNASDTSSNTSTASELRVNATRESIVISFPEIDVPEGVNSSRVKCARFEGDGSIQIGEMVAKNACLATSSGHFAIVVPSGVRPMPEMRGGGRRRWWIWVVVGGGIVGVVVVGLMGAGISKWVRNKKRELMEGRANEGVALGSVWIGDSKMPAAEMVRTQPVVETDTVP